MSRPSIPATVLATISAFGIIFDKITPLLYLAPTVAITAFFVFGIKFFNEFRNNGYKWKKSFSKKSKLSLLLWGIVTVIGFLFWGLTTRYPETDIGEGTHRGLSAIQRGVGLDISRAYHRLFVRKPVRTTKPTDMMHQFTGEPDGSQVIESTWLIADTCCVARGNWNHGWVEFEACFPKYIENQSLIDSATYYNSTILSTRQRACQYLLDFLCVHGADYESSYSAIIEKQIYDAAANAIILSTRDYDDFHQTCARSRHCIKLGIRLNSYLQIADLIERLTIGLQLSNYRNCYENALQSDSLESSDSPNDVALLDVSVTGWSPVFVPIVTELNSQRNLIYSIASVDTESLIRRGLVQYVGSVEEIEQHPMWSANSACRIHSFSIMSCSREILRINQENAQQLRELDRTYGLLRRGRVFIRVPDTAPTTQGHVLINN